MQIPNNITPTVELNIPEKNFGVDIIPVTRKEWRKYFIECSLPILVALFSVFIVCVTFPVMGKTTPAAGDYIQLAIMMGGIVLFFGSMMQVIELPGPPNVYKKASREIERRQQAWAKEELVPYLNDIYGINIAYLNVLKGEGYIWEKGDHDNDVRTIVYIEGINTFEDPRFFVKNKNVQAPSLIDVDMDKLRVKRKAPQEYTVLERKK